MCFVVFAEQLDVNSVFRFPREEKIYGQLKQILHSPLGPLSIQRERRNNSNLIFE
jgi:hypothetical protein